jgi:hypothetical protein
MALDFDVTDRYQPRYRPVTWPPRQVNDVAQGGFLLALRGKEFHMSTCFTDLDGLLADPLVQLVMAADGVNATAVRSELKQAAARVSNQTPKLAFARVRFAPDARAHGPHVPLPYMGCDARICC